METARMSDVDTRPDTATRPDLPVPSGYTPDSEAGIDVSEAYRDSRFERGAEREVSARQGADEVIRRRRSTQAGIDFHDTDAATEEIVILDKDGRSRADRHASLTQGDARRAAEEVASYRQQRNELGAQYLEQTYGENDGAADGAATAENYASEQPSEPPSEQELISQQIRAQQHQAEAARQQQAEARRAQVQILEEYGKAQQQVILQRVGQEYQALWGDLRTEEDVVRLAQTNPARAQQFAKWYQDHQAAAQQLNAQYQQQVQQYVQQVQRHDAELAWNRQCKAEDEAFSRDRPGLTKEMQAEALAYLREDLGINDEQIRNMWSMHPTQLAAAGLPSIRSVQAQKVLHDAALHRIAVRKAREIGAKTKHVPPVMRPGISRPKAFVDEDNLRALESRLERSGSVRTAAELVRVRRAVSR
jgi:hypothetical protein